jgi:hypothetical protein
MRKLVFWIGIILLLIGILFGFIAGATFPGNFTIPLIYSSNQTLWLFVAFAGLITTIVGLILRKKK